jgi:crotonobetainyl-CoA:carnitine CoA-transferase CaiB-like acyl-CoA transferase
VAYADIFTGVYAVTAIQAALLQRERTGDGATIDMALLDTQVAVLTNQAMNFLVSGTAPRRMGNAHPNLVRTRCSASRMVTWSSPWAAMHAVPAAGQVLGIPALADESLRAPTPIGYAIVNSSLHPCRQPANAGRGPAWRGA